MGTTYTYNFSSPLIADSLFRDPHKTASTEQIACDEPPSARPHTFVFIFSTNFAHRTFNAYKHTFDHLPSTQYNFPIYCLSSLVTQHTFGISSIEQFAHHFSSGKSITESINSKFSGMSSGRFLGQRWDAALKMCYMFLVREVSPFLVCLVNDDSHQFTQVISDRHMSVNGLTGLIEVCA